MLEELVWLKSDQDSFGQPDLYVARYVLVNLDD